VISAALQNAAYPRLDEENLKLDETKEKFIVAALTTLREIGKEAKAALPVLRILDAEPGDLNDLLWDVERELDPEIRR
jgi:hypothetical protein